MNTRRNKSILQLESEMNEMGSNYLNCFNSFMIDASASGFTPQSIRLYRSWSVSSSMSRSSKFAIWENPSKE